MEYWGIEAHPLRLQDLQRFYRRYEGEEGEEDGEGGGDTESLGGDTESLGAENLLRAWRELSPSPCPSFCRLPLVRWQFAPSLSLTLLLQDVERALVALPREVDGWYCDGFAPRANPAMWSEKVFSAIARCTRARASFPQLASFSVAKSVRTALNAYGFRTHKRKGLLTKREVLQGFFEGQRQCVPPPRTTRQAWLSNMSLS